MCKSDIDIQKKSTDPKNLRWFDSYHRPLLALPSAPQSFGVLHFQSMFDKRIKTYCLQLFFSGSQVIEQERQRVQALKERVQQEVKSKWAQRLQDCSSLNSSGSEDLRNR